MKKGLIFLIIISISSIQKISGQNYLNYYETINKAEIASLDKDFRKSDSIYQVAFQLVEKPFKDDYLLAALNSEKINDFQKSYSYLKSGISVGLTIKKIKKEFTKFKKAKQWRLLKKEFELIRDKYQNSLDLPLRNELMEMVNKDQAVRHPIFGSWKKMKKTDNHNYKRLLEIIKANNEKWPGRVSIGDGNEKGKYAFGEITIMLHHFSKEEVNNLKPILIEAILKGDLSPHSVAYPLDYKNSKKIGERKRGKTTFIYSCDNIGSYGRSSNKEIVICDCKKAENERKRMGLEPLDDYFRKIDSTYKCYEKENNYNNKK